MRNIVSIVRTRKLDHPSMSLDMAMVMVMVLNMASMVIVMDLNIALVMDIVENFPQRIFQNNISTKDLQGMDNGHSYMLGSYGFGHGYGLGYRDGHGYGGHHYWKTTGSVVHVLLERSAEYGHGYGHGYGHCYSQSHGHHGGHYGHH